MKQEEVGIFRGFVLSHDDKKVSWYCIEEDSIRETNISNDVFSFKALFTDMKLFEGKNIWFEHKLTENGYWVKCNESKQYKFIQLFNYYFRNTFKNLNPHA